MTEPVHPTPDELREQAETELDRVLGGSDYDGPSIAECVEADRKWALEKEGQ